MYNFSSFNSFITSTLGREIGVGRYWDFINLVWDNQNSRYYCSQTGLSPSVDSVAWGVLNPDCLNANRIDNFTYITELPTVRRGDIIILSYNGGAAGFINEDVDSIRNYDVYMQGLSNNYVTLENISINTFLGAFRYAWGSTPPTPPVPPVTTNKKRFPWVLYANKFRNQRHL